MVILFGGCSLSDLVDSERTSVGSVLSAKDAQEFPAAMMLYNGAIRALASGASEYAYSTALWTDELSATGQSTGAQLQLDVRRDEPISGTSNTYNRLHSARASAFIAIAALRKFPDRDIETKLSELYAVQGYALLMLAEGFCSTIPIADVTPDGDVKSLGGFTTEALLKKARALFDTALALAGSNASLEGMIRVGHARANLNLGEFDAIPTMIAPISTDMKYVLWYSLVDVNYQHWSSVLSFLPQYVIVNHEGGVGLLWRDGATDSRLPATVAGVQQKYLRADTSTLASYVEAKLMLAEVQLATASATDQRWLQTLNELRATRSLPDLTDPGLSAARVDLLFRERAIWLYLTGHRQGDLRRLIRQYGRVAESLWPNGPYTVNPNFPVYSYNVVMRFGGQFLGKPIPGDGGCDDINP